MAHSTGTTTKGDLQVQEPDNGGVDPGRRVRIYVGNLTRHHHPFDSSGKGISRKYWANIIMQRFDVTTYQEAFEDCSWPITRYLKDHNWSLIHNYGLNIADETTIVRFHPNIRT